MSNVLHGRWKQYYQIPLHPRIEGLSGAAHRYYAFLCRESNVRSAVDLRYSQQEIGEAIHIVDPKTLSKARRELVNACLIHCTKIPPGVYAHQMLDQDRNRIPPLKGRRGIRHYDPVAKQNHCAQQVSDTQSPPKAAERSVEHLASEGFTFQYCYAHRKVTPHSSPFETPICELCHPNPRISGNHETAGLPDKSKPFRQPSARELGF